jgi:hypothetical protein
MMVALAGQKINAQAQMRFDQAGTETWNVALDPLITYTGAQLTQLTNYCTANGLTLTIVVSQMGVT